jgi:hypothetical protein
MGIKSEKYGSNDSQMGISVGISAKELEDVGRANIVKQLPHPTP